MKISGVLQVLELYVRVLALLPWLAFSSVVTGFVSRGLTVSTFILTIKVFLVIIIPDGFVGTLNKVIAPVVDIRFTEDGYAILLIAVLVLLVILQFLTTKLHLVSFSKLVKEATKLLHAMPVHAAKSENTRFCIFDLPAGLDSVVKCLEIFLFYVVLLLIIFFISPKLFIAMLIAVSSLLGLLVFLGRKEAFVVRDLNTVRTNVLADDLRLGEYLQANSELHSVQINAINNSRFLGGIALILMILIYFFYFQDSEFSQLTALVLVFSIRFVVQYAGELSRQMGRLLQQRIIISDLKLRKGAPS